MWLDKITCRVHLISLTSLFFASLACLLSSVAAVLCDKGRRGLCGLVELEPRQMSGVVTARARVGPLFSPGISGPKPAHFFHG